jgi:hypothetical protein
LSAPVLSWLLNMMDHCLAATSSTRAETNSSAITLASNRSAISSIQAEVRLFHHQPSEPVLFPKLRTYFADFPYLHYPIDQRLLTLETWCGYGYDRLRSKTLSLGFSWTVLSAPDTSWSRCSSRTFTHSPNNSIPGWTYLLNRKDNASQGSIQRSEFNCVATLYPQSGRGIVTSFPFERRSKAPFTGINLALRIG